MATEGMQPVETLLVTSERLRAEMRRHVEALEGLVGLLDGSEPRETASGDGAEKPESVVVSLQGAVVASTRVTALLDRLHVLVGGA